MNETTPVQGSEAGNKKMIWIIVAVIAIVVVLWFSGVFGKGGARIGNQNLGPQAPGAESNQNADGSVTYTTEEGTVTVNGGGMPDTWPADAPAAYAGATFLYSGNVNPATGTAGAAIVYTTTASLSSVIEYYNARLKAEGWTVNSSNVVQGMTVITANKDSRVFVAYAGEANGVTQVTSGVELNVGN